MSSSLDSLPPVRVRFAPSPTGYLHVGGARTALFNWLYARRHGGTFVLRIEDTDEARNTDEARAAILDGLRWLGIDWDEGPEAGGDYGPYYQSQRQDIYDRYFQKLVDAGHTYTEENGAVRFRSPGQIVLLDDQICGQVKIDRTKEPDMTIRRPDGSYIFHFVNVVDDIEMKISHVIRGEDHIFNTGKHIELFQAFDAAPPVYAHIPLILNPEGSKMSKRQEGAAVGFYQQNAFLPAAVVNYLCLLGWSAKDDREILTIDEVRELFDWDHINHSNAKFDMEKCRWMNAQYLAKLEPDAFAALCRQWLAANPAPGADSPDLNAALALIHPKTKAVAEIVPHLAMLFERSLPIPEEVRTKLAGQADISAKTSALQTALAGAPEWTGAALQAAVAGAAAGLSVKPGALLFPLRVLALGDGHGVDLLPALEFLGREETLARLDERARAIAAA